MASESAAHINRIGILYRDLLSNTIRPLSEQDRNLLLSLEPNNKIVAIGDIDFKNWNAYPLTYMLDKKLVGPVVLDESKVYQSWHAMRTHDTSIIHPQLLVSECVIIRIIGLDSSPSINEYLNSFISMCIASDQCKLIFIIVDGDKKFYKGNIYTRKTNSSFIETSSGKPYQVESIPLCISPDQIVFFNHSKVKKSMMPNTDACSVSVKSTISSRNKSSLSSIINDSDMF